MKIVLFSDLHVHPHRFGATVDPVTGRHSRLQDCLDVLDQTAKYAVNIGANLRIFGGDMTHKRGFLAPSFYNPIIEHFRNQHPSQPATPFNDLLVPGNHDMEHRQAGEHSMFALAIPKQVTILEDHGFHWGGWGAGLDGDIGIGWVSYEPDIKKLKEKVQIVAAQRRQSGFTGKSIFICHHGVDGAMPGIPDAGFGVNDIPYTDFDWCFFGDYHNHKELIPGKAWMIGAPLQHNFGDAGQRRGWMTLDTDTGVVQHIENTKAPKFVAWQPGVKIDAKEIVGNFVRIRHDDEKELAKISALIAAAGAKAVQSELIKDWKAITRSDVSLSMTTTQLYAKWLDKEIAADPSLAPHKDALLKLNDEILAEAKL